LPVVGGQFGNGCGAIGFLYYGLGRLDEKKSGVVHPLFDSPIAARIGEVTGDQTR